MLTDGESRFIIMEKVFHAWKDFGRPFRNFKEPVKRDFLHIYAKNHKCNRFLVEGTNEKMDDGVLFYYGGIGGGFCRRDR